MGDVVQDKCAIVVAHSLHDVRNILHDLKSRGREAFGIGALGLLGIDSVKSIGTVDDFSLITFERLLPAPNYSFYMGHGRYATRGRKEPDKILQDAHPHVIGGTKTYQGNHIVTRQSSMSIVHNGQVDKSYILDLLSNELDLDDIETECDSELLLHFYRVFGEEALMKKILGSYSLAIFDKNRDEAIVMRDRYGIKPLWIGLKDGKHVVASEDFAIHNNGGKVLRYTEPGEIVYISRSGGFRTKKVLESERKYCFFEIIYLQNEDSRGIMEKRWALGKALAEEFRPNVDIVTYAPNCAWVAAKAYAEAIGMPEKYQDVFYKKKEDRSFQHSTAEEREASIDTNLYMFDNINLRGKRVLIIDDSIVRGTVARRIVELTRQKGGATEVYLASVSPIIGPIIGDDKHGCEYGVDMPPNPDITNDFAIRRYGSVQGITDAINATNVHYLSQRRMFEAIKMNPDSSCYHCIGGPKPFQLPQIVSSASYRE